VRVAVVPNASSGENGRRRQSGVAPLYLTASDQSVIARPLIEDNDSPLNRTRELPAARDMRDAVATSSMVRPLLEDSSLLHQMGELNVPLNTLLKQHRLQIDPEVPALGPYTRLPSRRGRRVTQEELAECIGISRVWYATLESSSGVRTSSALLDRLATALMVSPQERAALFDLAMPELKLAEAAGALRQAYADGASPFHRPEQLVAQATLNEHLADDLVYDLLNRGSAA
jgi:transcriptional regulator with XRE-family HTH domain